MTVLVIGSGAREHALALALTRDPGVGAVHAAPGNPGTAMIATNHAVDPVESANVVALAQQIGADLVVIGPEAPLVAGLADALRAEGFAVFGPGKEAAALEGSKAFAKQVMTAAGVPTAAARTCTTPDEVAAALDEFGAPYVVKDDGLAAGKGVVVTSDREAALSHAASCGRVVVEEFLDGPEVSLFAICDGTDAVALQPAQDFKRVGEGDVGPNTGGMGAYTPLPWAPPELADEVMRTVVAPTLAEMNRRGTPFTGLLYVGLALTSAGPRVVEFNVRFGDPETAVVLPALRTPLGGVLSAAARGTLATLPPLEWSPEAFVCVVMAAEGYPGTPRQGLPLVIPDESCVLHAGTRLVEGRPESAGGRVLDVVGSGPTLAAARDAAYAAVDRIEFPGGFYRRDIALTAAQQQAREAEEGK